jgi:hypothetical protein
MGDFDTANLLADWNGVLSTAGALTATTGGVTFSGVWAERQDVLVDMHDQLRDERRFTVFTTFSELATRPSLRQTIVRAGVTYAVEGIRDDVAAVGIELDVKRVI